MVRFAPKKVNRFIRKNLRLFHVQKCSTPPRIGCVRTEYIRFHMSSVVDRLACWVLWGEAYDVAPSCHFVIYVFPSLMSRLMSTHASA